MPRNYKKMIVLGVILLLVGIIVMAACAPAGAYPENYSTFEYRLKTPDGYGYTEWETPKGMVCISIAGDYFHCEFPR